MSTERQETPTPNEPQGDNEGPFGGYSPQEAGRKSGEARRAKRAAQGKTNRDITDKLRSKAAGGDVGAARELREWIREAPPDPLEDEGWMGLLLDEQRAQLHAWIDEAYARLEGTGGTGEAAA